MEQTTKQIDLKVKNAFQSNFPDIKVREPRVVDEGLTIVNEMRKMEVGDVLLFPVEFFNPGTIRCAPSGSLAKEQMMDGMAWSTKIDKANKATAVLRYQ